jgi:RND family efflux transporter MFP subunit
MATQTKSPAPDLGSLRIDERKRTSGRLGKWLGIFAALLGIVILAGGAILALRGQKPEVEVATARAASDPRALALLNASGYVTPRRRSTIAAKITGRVTGVFTDEGMRVTSGQVLATLDDSDARVRLASAKAERDATAASIRDLEVNLVNAEREVKRAQELEVSGIQSKQILDLRQTEADSLRARMALAREQVKAAEARIDVALQDVENATIRAPYDGLVVSKDAQVGEMVSPISAGGGFTRTGIATIVDMNSLEIEVDVNESYIARVKPSKDSSRHGRESGFSER